MLVRYMIVTVLHEVSHISSRSRDVSHFHRDVVCFPDPVSDYSIFKFSSKFVKMMCYVNSYCRSVVLIIIVNKIFLLILSI
jgi:hypothetical protein